MNCKEFKNKVPDYIEQKLDSDLNNQINEHLLSCAKCSLLFNNFNTTLSLLTKKERVEEQPFYFTMLKQKMENRLESKQPFYHILIKKNVLQPFLYLASIVIAVYIGILIGSVTPKTSQYSETKKSDTSYIEAFAQYQYINDMDLESIEKNMVNENILETTTNK